MKTRSNFYLNLLDFREGELKNLCTLSSAFPEIVKYYITSRRISFSENGYFSSFQVGKEKEKKEIRR